METLNIQTDIISKRNALNQVSLQLKQEFIGLDDIIDEVMNLMSSWYLFPQAQLRPLIINLWGMTGSGKTALVQRLVELLDYKKLYAQMDMGEFESDSASWIKSTFTDELEFFHEKSGIICFDEFQFARTLNNNGEEVGKDKLRVIWDMVDSGKIGYIPSNNAYYIKRSDLCLQFLVRAYERGVAIENGVVVANAEAFIEVFKTFFFENQERYQEDMSANYFLSRDFVDGVFYLFNDDETSREIIREHIKKADLKGIATLIMNGMKTRHALKTLDLSKSLIFILGNLDEAYHMSRSINPDIEADELHEATLKINITHIKSALRKRFRAEQIARLGNNHIVYRSFKSEHFKELITRELQRINTYVKEQFHLELCFQQNMYDMIYREGVFPAQGTRPVLTTIKNYIESWIGKLVIRVMENKWPVKTVEWCCGEQGYHFIYKNENGEIVMQFEEPVDFKLGSLRQKSIPGVQAHTAVHEAGHAVLAVLTLRILPSLIVSRSVDDESEGFCIVNFPEGVFTKDLLRKDIIISLGGYVAERLIFGDDNTSSGVWKDIEHASAQANRAIKSYAMGSDPISIAVYAGSNNDFFYTEEKYKEEALKLIRDCEKEAEHLLRKHKLVLLAISEYLTQQYKMEEAKIEEIVRAYCDEEWIKTEGFKRKDNYFEFNTRIQNQLKEMKKQL